MQHNERIQDDSLTPGDSLSHYGILGMRWGIRRFQNEDGTRTPEGKKRYREKPESETWKKSEAKTLSDAELNRRNSRLQREKQYQDLLTSDFEREAKQFKKDLVKKALILPVLGIASVAGRKYVNQAADFIVDYGKIAIENIKTRGDAKWLI